MKIGELIFGWLFHRSGYEAGWPQYLYAEAIDGELEYG